MSINDSQNHYYQQNTYPGQFTIPNSPLPQPPKKTLWSWFKRQKNGAKLGLGCGLGIFLLLICSLCGTISNKSTQLQTASINHAQTTMTTHNVFPTPTFTPTPISTPTPVPTPTPTPLPPTPMPIRPTPTPVPTQAPEPTQPPVQNVAPATGVNGNPWGYDFNPGNLIYYPPANFCSYFNCIASFWTSTNGYVDECVDGTYSHSGGRSGACSHHGGEMRPLYSHS